MSGDLSGGIEGTLPHLDAGQLALEETSENVGVKLSINNLLFETACAKKRIIKVKNVIKQCNFACLTHSLPGLVKKSPPDPFSGPCKLKKKVIFLAVKNPEA